MSISAPADLGSRVWAAMGSFRDTVPVQDQLNYVAALLFLKWLSDGFTEDPQSQGSEPDFLGYSLKLFYLPRRARWEELKASPAQGIALDLAMLAVEQENPDLAGIFWGVKFEHLPRAVTSALINDFSTINLCKAPIGERDEAGSVLEYIFQKAASLHGRQLGDYASPPDLAELLVLLIKPAKGMSIYDPACGIGSLLTRAAQHVRESKKSTDVSIVGRENNVALWARCRMNTVLHGLPSTGILLQDALESNREGQPKERFDRVITNPPFASRISRRASPGFATPEYPFGTPPGKNADFAWIQHAYASLKEGGTAGVLMPQGVLFRRGREALIRENMLRAGVIEGIVVLPPKILHGSGIPVVALLLRRDDPRETPVFMLDATRDKKFANVGGLNELDVAELAQRYHSRSEIPGVSRLVPLDEIQENEFVLSTPLYLEARGHSARFDLQQSMDKIATLEKRRKRLAYEMDEVLKTLLD